MAGLITLLPLILRVDLYFDDLERAMDGRLSWVHVGRPGADILVEWLNFARPATAVSPLYTLLTIAVLSDVGVVCAGAYGVRSPLWTALASLPLMAQPYALQALSYGFDSLFMAVSLACAVTAVLLVNLNCNWRVVGGAWILQL
ncbi:glucosyltransferase domain-containing protein [Synechococcus sp. BIOS-E4-1]|uniref:glucosyltransferase domain-containing protein n=1 Tax=Synechococcus sp. BIOS-E4-1 TaxID=1400864 RepID=UPI002105B732|nr:glucosyltransferase domain-containing protein [Synechococcus sp. BIOS-E4-1]